LLRVDDHRRQVHRDRPPRRRPTTSGDTTAPAFWRVDARPT